MICFVCKTEIQGRDSYFIVQPECRHEDHGGNAHDDCLIRMIEFTGDNKYAKRIFLEANNFYTLPKE